MEQNFKLSSEHFKPVSGNLQIYTQVLMAYVRYWFLCPNSITLPARAHASTQLLYYALLIQCPTFLKESCILCGACAVP
jgi:hypothetical protein